MVRALVGEFEGYGRTEADDGFGGARVPANEDALTATAAPAPDIAIMPLEPRIMMDATLDLGLVEFFGDQDPADTIVDMLTLANQLTEQMGAFSDALASQLADAMGSAADLFAGENDNSYLLDDGSSLDEAFASLRLLGDALADSITGGIEDDIEGVLNLVVGQLQDEFQDLTQTNFSGLSEDERTAIYSAANEALAGLDASSIFQADTLFRSVLEMSEEMAISFGLPGADDELPSGEAGNEPDYLSDSEISSYAASLKTAMFEAIGTGLSSSVPNFNAVLTLENISDKVIFTQGADTSEVDVEIAFGQMLPDLEAIFASMGLTGETVDGWDLMLDGLADMSFGFTISAESAGSLGDGYTTTLSFGDFFATTDDGENPVDGLRLGGALDESFIEGLGITAGLFSAEVTAIELALFELGFAENESISFSFSTSDFVVSTEAALDELLVVSITQAGASESETFNPDAEYTLAAIDFTATIDWGLGDILEGIDEDVPHSLGVEGTLALAGAVSAPVLAVSAQAKAFDQDGVEIGVSEDGDEARLEALTDMVLGLMDLEGADFINALSDAVSRLDIIFNSSLFDIELPFLEDFDLTSLNTLYQELSTALLRPMNVDLSILGLAAGNDTSSGGAIVIEALATDSETGTVLPDQENATIAFDLDITIDDESRAYEVSLDVPEGGFASMDALAAALKDALAGVIVEDITIPNHDGDVTLADIFQVSAVRGDIELRSNMVDGFTIADAGPGPSARAILGLESANDTASFDQPLTGTPLDALTGDGWMSLYQINLDIVRTVTFDDDSAETAIYRTFTLSPSDGAWTAEDLAGQLNDLFEAAGITMSAIVTEAGGLEFTVVEEDAEAAYSKDGAEVEDVAFQFSVAGAKASVATSIEALQGFVNEVLGEAVPGASLAFDLERGDLVLDLPGFSFAGSTEFSTQIAAALGPIAEVDIQAAVSLAAQFAFGFSFGVDLAGLFGAEGEETLSDFIFLENVAFSAEIDGVADDISGAGRLGIVEVDIGGDDTNQVAVGARFDAGLVGEDGDAGTYSTRIGLEELFEKARSLDGITSMVGTLDLVGTVGEDGAFVNILLQDVRVGVSGINIGIEETAIESVEASLFDIFAPTDWVLDIQSPVVSLIMGLGTDDFIDTLYNSLVLVDQLLNGLAEDLGFLGTDIPVLGISVLDAMDFAKDLAGELQAFKDSPNAGLEDISASLSSAFGLDEGDLQLVWDDVEKVFYVSLGLDFFGGETAYDFSLDLASLLEDMVGSDSAVANVLSVASSLGNVTGDGRIVLDADLGFDLTFGLDLAGVMGENSEAVTTITALSALAGVSQITYNTSSSGHGGRDVLVSVARTGGEEPEYIDIKVDLDGATTVGEAISALYEAIGATVGAEGVEIVVTGVNGYDEPVTLTVGANLSNLDGIEITAIGFVDTGVAVFDDADSTVLFGEGGAIEASEIGGSLVVEGVDLTADGLDLDAGYSFSLIVNGADPVAIAVGEAEDDGRTAEEFVAAINEAIAASMVSRADLGLGLPVNISLGKLVVAQLDDDGHLVLGATNFAETIGKDPISFAVAGALTGLSSEISVFDLGGSNIARALGFDGVEPGTLAISGADLSARGPDSGVQAFLVTEDIEVAGKTLGGTGIRFEFIAGVPEGLNMSLAFGPLSVNVVDGVAVIGDGEGDNAFVRFGLDDGADDYLGSPDDGRLYIGAIADAFTGSEEIAPDQLFTFDAKAALELVLPLQDSLGLLSSVEDAGISISGDLFATTEEGLSGALVTLFTGDGSISDDLDVEIKLPDFSELLANINPYAILNDPILLTNGLETILAQIDKTLRAVIRAMDLPIVGDAMTQGLTVFNDIASAILEPIKVAANTPDADGELPTTIDLLTGVVNDALKSLFGVEDDLIRAVLTKDQDNPSIVAELFLSDFTIFQAILDVGFDLGVPGFHLDVGENSALEFEVLADINIAFGLDKMGFFFLNDTDNAEIVIKALVRTGDDFVASASLGLVGMALSGKALDSNGHETGYGAEISGSIEIDLFTDLGTEIDFDRFNAAVSDYGRGNGYENIVRLNELSTSKSGEGEGTRLVSITGVFAVHVDMGLTTSVVNPVDGQPITALPSALADFVFDARYEIGGELEMITLEFQDVGIYAGDFLKDNVLPVLNQINAYVSPIADMVQFLKDTAIGSFSIYDLIYQITQYTAPAALFVFEAVDTITGVIDFITDLGDDATVYFGSFSLLSPATSTGVVDTSSPKGMGNLRVSGSASAESSLTLEGAITNSKPGISFDLVALTDVSNVLNLISGNLEAVELFEIDITLLDFTLDINLVAALKSAVSFIPGEVVDALLGGASASFYIHAGAGLTVGYDLYGIAQFLGSGEAEDILDGMYFDADRSLLELDASFRVGLGINLAVIKAGLELSGYFALEISMNDPNDDGKLRMSELIWVVADNSIFDLFEGSVAGGLGLSVYFELDLFFFSVGGSWDILDISFYESFGATFDPVYLTDDDGVTTLNVGAAANRQVGGDVVDGNDEITIDGRTVMIGDNAVGSISGNTLLIYAGEGDNVIDLSRLSSEIDFQVFTGDGDDTIIVGNSSGIISTGSGNDQVLYGGVGSAVNFASFGLMSFGMFMGGASPNAIPSAPGGTPAMPTASTAPTSNGAVSGRTPSTSDQSLLILGSGGDTIDMSGYEASMIVVATALEITGNQGERIDIAEWAQAEFQGDDYYMDRVKAKIDEAMPTFTALSQTRGDDGDTFIRTGTGNDIIFAGKGNDTIISEGGNNIIFAGAGNDAVTVLGDGDNWIEGGAGGDVILGSGGNDTIMGWGRFDASTTIAEYEAALGWMTGPQRSDFADLVRTLVLDDGGDWIEGGAGEDILVGNGGARNVILGGDEDDLILAGTGNDILVGGDAEIRLSNNTVVSQVADFNPVGRFTISAVFGEDGDDRLYGGAGNNVIIGGGGSDEIEGVKGTNVLVGDYADVTFSGASTALSVISTGIDEMSQGDDAIIGGALADVIVAGGGADLVSAGNGRNIVIGDNARLTSTNLFEGVTSLVSLLGAMDDADAIYSGINWSVIVAGGSRSEHGDYISTGHVYNAPEDAKAEGVIVFGDYGDLEGALLAPATITTTFDAGDADVIITRGGNDIIFGGGGDDQISSGNGDDIIFGDTGTYRLVRTAGVDVELSTDHDALANPQSGQTLDSVTSLGDDLIAAGDGDNIVFGGAGADLIATGAGDDLVLGDNGYVELAFADGGNQRLYAEGRNTAHGGDDVIETNAGDDVILGGFGNDTIDAGADNDIALGDWAMVDFVAGSVSTQAREDGGADTIAGGDGDDIVIGGREGDRLSGGGDANVIIGDYASLTWSGRFDIVTLTLDGIDTFGDDLIYLGHDPEFASGQNAEGNSIGVGGRGDDEIHGGAGNDMILGDWGIFALLDPALYPNMSAFDRIVTVESTLNWARGDDRLYGHDGRDIIIGGDGDDYIEGGDGQDLLAGDAAIYRNDHDGWELFESRFPFSGGDDVIRGGAGNDIVVSGFFNLGVPGAGDRIEGDTVEDFLMGDAGSILIFEGKVIRFNYLGIETKELISDNQLGASAGVLMRPADYVPDMLRPIMTTSPFSSALPGTLDVAFDPEADIARGDEMILLSLDNWIRAVLLDREMLALFDMYRQGAIFEDDLEEAIREALQAMLFDRYGSAIPGDILAMVERYIEVLLNLLDEERSATGSVPQPDVMGQSQQNQSVN
ncbi:calcium-binding protein [Pelagibacterium montanilacus]|uniref:calcium-binding protein n=1 Tax=Pelagibacterium montanilacus TaxID=2185280 RepID=UPI000F8C8B85|nr:calcium-binding protein [Pelagibacterium montanilacus]